jgi:hypothetical protein
VEASHGSSGCADPSTFVVVAVVAAAIAAEEIAGVVKVVIVVFVEVVDEIESLFQIPTLPILDAKVLLLLLPVLPLLNLRGAVSKDDIVVLVVSVLVEIRRCCLSSFSSFSIVIPLLFFGIP